MLTSEPAAPSEHAEAADCSVEYAENGMAPAGTFFAHDQDGDVIEWQLSGPNADWITNDDDVLSFREPRPASIRSLRERAACVRRLLS